MAPLDRSDRTALETSPDLRVRVAAALVRAEGFQPHEGDIDNWTDHADRVLAVVAEALYDRCLNMPANHPARLGYRAASRFVRRATYAA